MLQSTEELHKKEIDDSIQRTRNELAFEYELTIGDLQNRLDHEKESNSETEKKYRDLDKTHEEFVESTLMMKKEYTDLKF